MTTARADPSQSNHADRRTHDAGTFDPLPVAGADPLILIGEATGDAHQQGDGVLGDGVMVHAGRSGDDHAMLVAGGQVDRVEADAGPGDDSQVGTAFDDRAGVRFGAGDDGAAAVEFADQRRLIPVVAVAVAGQDLEPGLLQCRKMRTLVGVEGTAADLERQRGISSSAGLQAGGPGESLCEPADYCAGSEVASSGEEGVRRAGREWSSRR